MSSPKRVPAVEKAFAAVEAWVAHGLAVVGDSSGPGWPN